MVLGLRALHIIQSVTLLSAQSPAILSLFLFSCIGRSLSTLAQGDLVQLKEVPTGASIELKSKSMDYLVTAHGLRHENINPLIGNWCFSYRLVFARQSNSACK